MSQSKVSLYLSCKTLVLNVLKSLKTSRGLLTEFIRRITDVELEEDSVWTGWKLFVFRDWSLSHFLLLLLLANFHWQQGTSGMSLLTARSLSECGGDDEDWRHKRQPRGADRLLKPSACFLRLESFSLLLFPVVSWSICVSTVCLIRLIYIKNIF